LSEDEFLKPEKVTEKEIGASALEKILIKALEEGVSITDKFTIATEDLFTLLLLEELKKIDKADVLLQGDTIHRFVTIYNQMLHGRKAFEKIDGIARKKGYPVYRSGMSGLNRVRINVIRYLRNPQNFRQQLARETEAKRETIKRVIEILEKMVSEKSEAETERE
jgi:hypothetical protein